MLNDISAGRDDPAMLPLAARRRVPIVLMHMQGEPATMQQAPRYDDVVGEVLDFLRQRAAAAEAAGVEPSQIVIDPGIGFGKTVAHNVALMGSLERFVASGYPVMLGASRKGFLAKLTGEDTPESRRTATLATTALAAAAGVQLLRVHDVKTNREAAAVASEIAKARRHTRG
jgi:dihydropteroate synthase